MENKNDALGNKINNLKNKYQLLEVEMVIQIHKTLKAFVLRETNWLVYVLEEIGDQ